MLLVRVVSDLEFDPLQLTLLGTALELSVLVAEVPTGVVADLVSRRLSVIVSFLVMGPAIAAAGLVDGFWAMAATQVVWGIGYTFQSGADVAWVTDELGADGGVDRLLLRRAKVQMVAMVVGVIGAAGLAATVSRSGAIVTIGVVVTAWALVLAVVMPERGFTRQPGAGLADFTRVLRVGGDLARRTPVLRRLVTGVLLAAVAAEAIDRLEFARLTEVGLPDGIDEVTLVAILMISSSLLGILLVRRIERFVDRRPGSGVAPTVLGGLFVATAAMVALVAGAGVFGVVAVAIVAKEAALLGTDPLMAMIANDHDESAARATVLSFVGQATAAGEIVGGIALGALARSAGLSTALMVSAALFVLAGVVVARPSGPVGSPTWTSAP